MQVKMRKPSFSRFYRPTNERFDSWCQHGVQRHADVWGENEFTIHILKRKPTHTNEYWQLKKKDSNYWVISDAADAQPSPWPQSFDRFLSRKFPNSKTLYVWIELP